MSDLSFLAHPSITFKSGNLAHCINNELADRYFHVCFFVVGHMNDISVFGIVYIKT